MLFPDSPRVVYQQNPLDQVICQLRFPQILRVDTEVPVDFQEKIRARFPLVEEKRDVSFPLPEDVAQSIPMPLRESLLRGKRHYDFKTKNEEWIVSLETDFLSLTTRKYMRWEEFSEYLAEALNAVLNIYEPPFFTRIGLRYVDVIRKSKLNLKKEVEWFDLLQPHLAGVFTARAISNAVEQSTGVFVINLEDVQAKVRVQHGTVIDSSTGEECYLIDSDFFTTDGQTTEVGNVIDTLNNFNKQGRRLFRWCITEELHSAMGPQPII